jgi:hypothetical protein
MKLSNNIWLLGILMMIECGNSNQVEIAAPGVVSATVVVKSLSEDETLSRKSIFQGTSSIGGAEIGLSGVSIKIENGTYVNQVGDESEIQNGNLQAIVDRPAESERVNVNAFTTLAACRFKVKTTEQIHIQNQTISKQFLIADLHIVKPNLNLRDIKELDNESIYGLLMGGFEHLATAQNVSVPVLLDLLCADVAFDGMFNGVSKEGVIQSEYGWYDDQLLKSRLADSIYAFAQKEVKNIEQLPIDALANEISLSNQVGLFGETTLNYSFDQ